jgi:hypothetical protein
MDVSAPGESHRIEIGISDGDEGEIVHGFDLIVLANRLPMGGAAVFPPEGGGVTQTMPRLVVSNATDLDRDPIGYYFFVDRVDTFDSPELLESPRVDEGAGYTDWYVTAPLGLGRWFWRAVPNDGTADGLPIGASFFVVPGSGVDAGLPPVDGGGSGGVDSGMTVTPPKKDDSGCSVGPTRPEPIAIAPILAGAVLALAVSRRARR